MDYLDYLKMLSKDYDDCKYLSSEKRFLVYVYKFFLG